MLRLTELALPLHHADEALPAAVCKRLRITPRELIRHVVSRRAHDARDKAAIQLVYTIDVNVKDESAVLARFRKDRNVQLKPNTSYKFVAQAPTGAKRPVVVGAGPCGLFAGLILAQMGFRPIILDRGKVVRERTKDTWGLWRRGVLDAESNVQFGEGGAGTFSDGKLYSRIKDPRHLDRKVLTEFVKAGAPPEILTEAHPHIGTFRLVTMVESLRETIEGLGGEYRWQHKVDGLDIATNGHGERQIQGLHLSNGGYLEADHVVLAVGHSARDTFAMLHAAGVHVEAKPFSIGVRIEHPQSWIDRSRFGADAGNEILGAAEYHISHHCRNGRTVYSFCMCPGGTVVAATSEEGRVATNGMSQYSRNERNANSGFVVAIDPARDYPGDPLAGIAFQRHWESLAYVAGGSNYRAPAQRVGDFLAGRASTSLGSVTPSYRPGVTPTDLAQCLPDFVVEAMREAIPVFGRQIAGYDHPDVVMTGVETRTSSPVRFTRGDDFQSLNTAGLFPAGEGAGYAGGILSAAVDGIKVAEAVAAQRGRTRHCMTLILFNKPYDVLSQFTDRGTAGSTRRTLSDFIDMPGVYPAGRLDLDSEGLMLLTDDGRLQARIADPQYKLPKTYLVQVEGNVTAAALAALRQGVRLKDGPTRPAEVEPIADPQLWPRDPPIRVRKSVPDGWIRLTIHEGRNRQVRRMTAAVGHPTLRLIRWSIGDWTVEGLSPGQWQCATA